MIRKNFGQLVAALRSERFDPVIGKSWTQQMLAERTGLTSRIIGEIERGERVKLDADILLALAQAFGLTTLERREFFAAVTEIEDIDASLHRSDPNEILQELIDTFQSVQLPAFIHDPFFDMIAINSLFKTFHSVPQDAKNYLSFFFNSNKTTKRLSQQTWHSYAMRNLLQFRYMTLRYRYTDYYQWLFRDLCTSPYFREIWAQCLYIEDDHHSQVKTYDYLHQEFGPISYAVTSTSTLTPYGLLYLSVVIPKGQHSWKTVVQLVETCPLYIQRINAWPNPTIYHPTDADSTFCKEFETFLK